MKTPRAVVFVHGSALRSPPVRAHHLARHLASRIPVVYVPYRSPVELLMGDRRRPPWPALAQHPNVRHVGLPPTVFLSRRSRAAAAFHAALAARGIRRTLREMQIAPEETVLFLELATGVDLLRHFPETPVMYDCADDTRNWHRTSPRMRRMYGEMEDTVARRASWIIISIPRLAERFAGCAAELIPGVNGVDEEFFVERPAARNPGLAELNGHLPADLRSIPRPWLLYVGIMSAYVDAGLVEAVARSGVGSVVLVGPVDPRAPVARLRGRPNLYWLDRKDYEQLPEYLRAADVALIPATRTAASDCIPSKLLMYCAAGLPIVARDCSSFRPYADRILLAESAEQFVAQIRAALAGPEWQRNARIGLAREHTWSALAARLCERMGLAG